MKPSQPKKAKRYYSSNTRSTDTPIVKKSRAALINRLGVLPRKSRG